MKMACLSYSLMIPSAFEQMTQIVLACFMDSLSSMLFLFIREDSCGLFNMLMNWVCNLELHLELI